MYYLSLQFNGIFLGVVTDLYMLYLYSLAHYDSVALIANCKITVGIGVQLVSRHPKMYPELKNNLENEMTYSFISNLGLAWCTSNMYMYLLNIIVKFLQIVIFSTLHVTFLIKIQLLIYCTQC